MSGIRPFEGSGEPFLTTTNISSTTASTDYYVEHSSRSRTSRSSTISTGHDNTTTIASSLGDQESNSTSLYPFLLPLWAWAAILLGVAILLSLLLICITLTVGWRKGKKRRRHRQVNLRSPARRHRCNSSLWIDLEQVETVDCAVDITTVDMTKSSKPTSQTRLGNSSISRKGSIRRKLQETREKRSQYYFSEEDLIAMRSERDQNDQHQSAAQHMTCNHKTNYMCLELNQNLLHLQPGTTLTFKRNRSQKHKLEEKSSYDSRSGSLNDTNNRLSPAGRTDEGSCTCACTPESKVDLGIKIEDDPYPLIGTCTCSPACNESDTLCTSRSRSLESSASRDLERDQDHHDQQIRMNDPETSHPDMPPRSIYSYDITDASVTTFPHRAYAFKTL